MAACHHGLGWSPNRLGVSGRSGAARQSRRGLAGSIWLLRLGPLSSVVGNLHPRVQGKRQGKENKGWAGKCWGEKGEITSSRTHSLCWRRGASPRARSSLSARRLALGAHLGGLCLGLADPPHSLAGITPAPKTRRRSRTGSVAK